MPREYVDRGQFNESGFYLEKRLIGTSSLDCLKELATRDAVAEEGRGGVRNFLDVAAFRKLAGSAPLLKLPIGLEWRERQVFSSQELVERG